MSDWLEELEPDRQGWRWVPTTCSWYKGALQVKWHERTIGPCYHRIEHYVTGVESADQAQQAFAEVFPNLHPDPFQLIGPQQFYRGPYFNDTSD